MSNSTWGQRLSKLERNGHGATPEPRRRWVTKADLDRLFDAIETGIPANFPIDPEDERMLNELYDRIVESQKNRNEGRC
jgi:hypothetical protein